MSSKGTPVKVLICVPSFRGSIMTHTAASLIDTVWTMAELGIGMQFRNVDSAEIVSIRNAMGSYMMTQDDLTHLLFIDDDMKFDPDTIIGLLRSNKDVIGAVCPFRKIDLAAFRKAAVEGKSLEQCEAAATEFVVRHYPDQIAVNEGIFKIRGIGMAVTLIRRNVLQTMVDRNVVEKRRRPESIGPDPMGNMDIYGFFDPIKDINSESLLSEDYSFCQRWYDNCGGEVFALCDATIGHIGPHTFSGKYLDRLKIGML